MGAITEPFAPWVVIVAKRLARAKTRLALELGSSSRKSFARGMLECVLAAAQRAEGTRGTLVATDGEDVAQVAAGHGATVLRDPAALGVSLSEIADAALDAVGRQGATHALVLMADLPLIQAGDVSELLALQSAVDMLLVPDLRRTGTNALGLRLGSGLRTCLGHRDSLSRHLLAATRHRARVVVNPRVALDVDTCGDLRQLRALRQ